MNWLDIIIIVLIAVSTFSGLKMGLIKEVLTLAGLIIGVILAGRFYAALAPQLSFISQTSIAKVAAFAIILIGVMVIAGVAAGVLKWLTSAVMLGWVDRLGGAALGFIMGALFCSALLALWVKFLGAKGPIADSALALLLLDKLPMVLALLPKEFDSVRSFFR